MCGIVGIAGHVVVGDRTETRHSMPASLEALRHRGPDGNGWVQVEDMPVVLGHTRLAIIDLGESSSQPMVSESRRFWLTYNGEIYNFRELRQQLEAEGVTFSSVGDTEVLLRALESWGVPRTLDMIRGMFAFALVDRQCRKLTLARDRFGEKPFYFAVHDGSFYFASEIKAMRVGGLSTPLDIRQSDVFLQLAYCPPPATIYDGVTSLQPGHFLEVILSDSVSVQDVALHRYFDPVELAVRSRANQFRGGLADASRQLLHVLDASVSRQMLSDVPLGAFLSGGIDSSLVVSSMVASEGSQVSTFSIGFSEEDFNEAQTARAVADFLGTKHTEFLVTEEDALSVIPHLPIVYDDPFGDSSAIPTYLLAKLTRQHVTVALSGDGGDELFGGYNRYFIGTRLWDVFSHLPRPLRRFFALAVDSLPARRLDQLGRAVSGGGRFFFDGRLSPRRQQLLALLNCSQIEDLYLQVVTKRTGWETSDRGLDQLLRPLPADLGPAEKMMLWDVEMYLPGDILTKVDRAAMANSLETRVPFLDPEIFAFAWSLPIEFKIHRGQGKLVLKEALGSRIPRTLWDKPKRGFALPLALWLRSGLKDWAESLLFDGSTGRDLVSEQALRKLWLDHQSGVTNQQDTLWSLLMLKMWVQKWSPDS